MPALKLFTLPEAERTLPLVRRIVADLMAEYPRWRAAVSRYELLREVWNITFDPESNLVDAHISTLRSALERAGEPRLIETVRGVGYRLRASA